MSQLLRYFGGGKEPRNNDDVCVTPKKKKLSLDSENCNLPLLSSPFDPSTLVVKPLPDWATMDGKKFAVVVENVLTEEECKSWIDATEEAGYGLAMVNVGYGQQVEMTDYRNSSRCIVDSVPAVEEIFQRISHIIPQKLTFKQFHASNAPLTQWHLAGLNERLRFLKYDLGQYFAPHFDGSYMRPRSHPTAPGDTSFITLQVYLNGGTDVMTGGTTRFHDVTKSWRYFDVVPKPGSVLLFDHQMYHSGEKVTKGRKYAIRTDVMYTANKKVPNPGATAAKKGCNSNGRDSGITSSCSSSSGVNSNNASNSTAAPSAAAAPADPAVPRNFVKNSADADDADADVDAEAEANADNEAAATTSKSAKIPVNELARQLEPAIAVAAAAKAGVAGEESPEDPADCSK